jgi:pimeloyl-ACP methyl ester carboxylesterase
MPTIQLPGFTMYYEQQGSGEPLILLPFLTADQACYSFQVAEYAKHFTCFTVDHRGAGQSSRPPGPYSTEMLAEDVAAFMDRVGIAQAHISGLSLGAAVGLWLAAKYPKKVKSLSLHSGWTSTDPYIRTFMEGCQIMATALGSVPEMVIRAMFPQCFTPELYASRPEYIEALAEFVRSRPAQSVDAFVDHSNAVIAHDAEAQLSRIQAPTLITFGRYDAVTSTRFAAPLKNGIRNSELVVFEECSHAPNFERVEEFNARTLDFLRRQVTQPATARIAV